MVSTYRTEVVKVKLLPHPNADSLSLVQIYGYQVVVRTSDWLGIDLGAYIVPDSVVDTSRSEFSFLGDNARIKVRRFRGTCSQGLLVKAPEGSKEGDNVADILGVKRYEPPEDLSTGGDNERGPEGWCPKYDVDSWFRYKDLFQTGEEVVVTEKVHGASARYTYKNGRMYCGSRTSWKKEDDKNVWWKALKSIPAIEEFCKLNADMILYGEVYGQVQDLKYNHSKGKVSFVAFDVWRVGNWVGWNDLGEIDGFSLIVPYWVPTIYKGPYIEDKIRSLADGKSTVARIHGDPNQIREGIVVKPTIERTDPEIGRVQMKLVSDLYLERS
jgi:RNA ligase (TIGR02306 family)